MSKHLDQKLDKPDSESMAVQGGMGTISTRRFLTWRSQVIDERKTMQDICRCCKNNRTKLE